MEIRVNTAQIFERLGNNTWFDRNLRLFIRGDWYMQNKDQQINLSLMNMETIITQYFIALEWERQRLKLEIEERANKNCTCVYAGTRLPPTGSVVKQFLTIIINRDKLKEFGADRWQGDKGQLEELNLTSLAIQCRHHFSTDLVTHHKWELSIIVYRVLAKYYYY